MQLATDHNVISLTPTILEIITVNYEHGEYKTKSVFKYMFF